MLRRSQSKENALSPSKSNCARRTSPKRRLSGPDEVDLPTPPSTPSKRQCVTPSPVRRLTKQLDRVLVNQQVNIPRAAAVLEEKKKQQQQPNYCDKENTAPKQQTQDTIHARNVYQEAKALFRRSTLPERLVGRESERKRLLQFWDAHVSDNKPGCLYISGSPGTGKTALLTDIMRAKKYDHQKVKFVTINCMSVSEPKAIYTKLFTELKPRGKLTDPVKDTEALLTTGTSLNVVFLDEIDQLSTRHQDVLYKLFEWASSPTSRLVLIGIANALNMTDRLLPRLRTKNCEPELLNFNPYQVADITAIIKDRLATLSTPVIQPAAIEMCARKVAASMGDLRTALDICRRAIELAETEHKKTQSTDVKPATIPHVLRVLNAVFGSPTKQKLRQLNLQQKVVLTVLMIMVRQAKRQPNQHITVGKFRKQYASLCAQSDEITPVSSHELSDVLSMLETSTLVSVGKSKEEQLRRIHLSIQESEIHDMVTEVPLLKTWVDYVCPE